MSDHLSFVLAQLNPTLGDIDGNLDMLRALRATVAHNDAHDDARNFNHSGCDLIVTSELFVCGYPPEDLVVKPSFLQNIRRAVERIAAETADGGPAILLGAPWVDAGRLYNAALLLDGGKITAQIFKNDLPNYGPFDEKRVFAAGPLPQPIAFRGYQLGVMICEDMWKADPAQHLRQYGAQILIVLNGSPFEVGKDAQRKSLAKVRCAETGLPLIYVNQVGGQDELVFDGASFICDARGEVLAEMPPWHTDHMLVRRGGNNLSVDTVKPTTKHDETSDIYNTLVLGLRDYVSKNNFPGVVLGMSGGIDSALAAAIAVDALGPEKVWGVMLPSPYTSTDSTEDARESARMLGCRLDCIPIADAMRMFDASLSPVLGAKGQGVVAENLQSRSRGVILMALSNAFGHMVLSTGNKSEMAVGYATLYGDMCGGFAVLKDVYKTQIYRLAAWRNANQPKNASGPAGPVIPARVLTKAPTAELRPNQTDQDSLPPYDILDAILADLIEQDFGVMEIIAKGFDPATVKRVAGMLKRAEYKRRQAPPGVKITGRSLSRDRRYPITNHYNE